MKGCFQQKKWNIQLYLLSIIVVLEQELLFTWENKRFGWKTEIIN